jgi:predicted alpha/beta superfamily hydrolase
MTSRLRRFTFVALLAVPLAASGQATAGGPDGQPVVIGRSYLVPSLVLNEDRPIQVYFPPEYQGSTEAFPVIYVLDGPGHLLHTTSSMQFLADNQRMPQMIVVSIGNTGGHRTRDLTPPITDSAEAAQFADAGGADRFLQFLETELKPWIASRFRVSPFSMLIGHSFGGLFITHVLNTDPGAFNAYIAISPSLWWDKGTYTDSLASLFARHPDAKGSLFMTMGNEGGDMIAGAWRFLGTLETAAPASFRWHWQPMPEEDHGSVPNRSTYDGLEWIFAEWSPRALFRALATEGMAAYPALEAHFARVATEFGSDPRPTEGGFNQAGYTLRGSDRAAEGVRVFEKVVELYPESANAHDSLGDGLVAACRFEDARREYATAISMATATGLTDFAAAYRGSLAELDALVAAGGGECAGK